MKGLRYKGLNRMDWLGLVGWKLGGLGLADHRKDDKNEKSDEPITNDMDFKRGFNSCADIYCAGLVFLWPCER